MKRNNNKKIFVTALCLLCCTGIMTSCGNIIDEESDPIGPRSSLVKYTSEPSEQAADPSSAVSLSSADDQSSGSDQSSNADNSSESDLPAQSEPGPEEPVREDTIPPVVTVKDIYAYKGESISYKKQFAIEDNSGGECELSFDSSEIDLGTVGEYVLPYTVKDPAGNAVTGQVKVIVVEKPVSPEEELDNYLHQQCQAVLAKITTPEMTPMQKAYSIYFWTKYNIYYTGYSDKSSWKTGARDGFQKRAGDCFTYFAVSKALLTEAGVPNVDVIKKKLTNNEESHFWSLVDVGSGWYHFDCTYYKYGNFSLYLMTDAEVAAWDKSYRPNNHRFVPEGLPERATASVQGTFKYGNPRI